MSPTVSDASDETSTVPAPDSAANRSADATLSVAPEATATGGSRSSVDAGADAPPATPLLASNCSAISRIWPDDSAES